MRKLAAPFTLFLTAITLQAAPPAPVEILNGGFEAEGWDAARRLPHTSRWEINPQNDFVIIERSTTEKKAGESSFHLKDIHTGHTNEGVYCSFSSAELKSLRGRQLRLTGWIKQASSSPAGSVSLGISVKTADDKWLTRKSGPETGGATDWNQYAAKLVIPEDAASVRVVLACANGWGGTGEAWFDALEAIASDPEPEEPAAPAFTGSRIAVFDDELRLHWTKGGWGGVRMEETELDPYSGQRRLRVNAESAKAYSGFSLKVKALNRQPNLSAYASDGALEFFLKPSPSLQVALMNGEKSLGYQPLLAKYLSPAKDGWSRASIPLADLSQGTTITAFSGISFQFTRTPPSEEIRLDAVAIVSPRSGLAAPMELDPALKQSIADAVGPERAVTTDGWTRPEIRNGTFYWQGKPQFIVGPWHYDRDTDFKGEKTHREGCNEKPFHSTLFSAAIARELGFTSLQLSSAPTGPALLSHGAALDRDSFERTLFYPGFLQGLAGIPIVVDYAWVSAFEDARLVEDGLLPARALQQNTAWHSFIPLCPEHPKGREIYRDYYRSGATYTLKHGGNPFLYELFNESSYNCTCQFNREAFTARMKARYHDLAQANAAWGTDFPSWEAVAAEEKHLKHPALWIDWVKFTGDRYAEILEEGKRTIRELDQRPNVYFTEQPSIPNFNTARGASMDYLKIAGVVDVLGVEGGVKFGRFKSKAGENMAEAAANVDGITYSLYLDMAVAQARGKPVVNDELYCGRFEDGQRVPSRRGDLCTSLWNELVHGSSASFFYSWDKRSFDWKTFEEAKQNVIHGGYKAFSLLNTYAYPPESLEGIGDFARESGRLAELVLPMPRIKGSVAFLFSQPAMRMSAISKLDTGRLCRDLYSALLMRHFPIEIVYEEQIADLDRFQAVVIPFLDQSYDKTLSTLQAWVEKGGTAVLSAGALSQNEYGREKDASRFLGIDRTRSAFESILESGGVDVPVKGEFKAIPQRASVVLKTKSGEPFLLEHRLGKGKVYYLCSAPSAELAWHLLPLLLKGVDRHGEVLNRDGKPAKTVELQLIDRGEKMLYYLVNWDSTPLPARLVPLKTPAEPFYLGDPATEELYLARSGKPHWTAEEARQSLDVFLPSQERRLLLLTREKPKGWKPVAPDERRKQEHTW